MLGTQVSPSAALHAKGGKPQTAVLLITLSQFVRFLGSVPATCPLLHVSPPIAHTRKSLTQIGCFIHPV